MGSKVAAILLTLGTLALRGQTPAATSPCNNTPAYSPCEVVFELSDKDAAAHPNPYLTVDVKVEFRSPRRRTLALPMYWDGGRRMVVRFSPNEVGEWDYKVSGNIAEWAEKSGTFTVAAGDTKGFIRPANVHHWAYTERDSRGLDQAHLWMGATELLFGSMDDAAFRAVADARASQKFNHLRGFIVSDSQPGAFSSAGMPDVPYFKRLDDRVRYLNQKGLIADLILAGGAGYLTKAFPTRQQRERFVRYVAGRYAAFNITWLGVDGWEDYPDAREPRARGSPPLPCSTMAG